MARKTDDAPALTHPDRVIYPTDGITKRELAQYLSAAARWMLPHLEGRPLAVLRVTHGTRPFVQKHFLDNPQPGLRIVELPRYKNEERQDYVLCRTAEGLLELAQLGVAEIHTFGSRYPRVDRADRLTFDLDPDPDLPWTQVRDAALTVRELLDRIGFESFVKTTGGKGLHVVAPLRAPLPDWDLAKRFTRAVSEYLAQSAPGVFVAKAGERNRVGRIFVDYLRNGYGATTVAAFSPRWRPGVRISVPLRWGELSRAQSMPVMGLREAARALARWRADPWRGYAEVRQTLRETAIARIAPQRPARRVAARKSATSADRIASSPPP